MRHGLRQVSGVVLATVGDPKRPLPAKLVFLILNIRSIYNTVSFPLSIAGQFDVRRQTYSGDVRAQVVEAATNVLKERGCDVEAGERSVSAWPNSWSFGSWHPMFLLAKISIIVCGRDDCATVRYEISTRILLNYVSVGVLAFPALIVWSDLSRNVPPRFFPGLFSDLLGGVFAAGLGWWWLFGMNYLLASWRAPGWLRRRIEERLGVSID